jgi:hypothetical protein
VKQLLHILSFLIFSSFLTSCDKIEGTLYRLETSSGFEWKKIGDKNNNPQYKGEVNWSNKPNGVGTLVFLNGDKYIGEFDDGRKDGLGTYTWSNHEGMEKYVGEFTNDDYGKIGEVFFKGGHIFEGEFFTEYVDGQFKDIRLRKGVKTLPDGSKYEGVWRRRKDGKISKWKIKGYDKDGEIVLEIYEGNGKGLYVFSDGSKFLGEWKDGLRHGQGKYTYHNGDKYEGEYKDGIQNGQGTLTRSNGEKYVGEWKKGENYGQGTYTWPNGEKYVGEIKNWEKHGQGTFTFSDGTKYVGDYKDGTRHGQGTWSSTEGEKYVGDYKDGLRHGQGTWSSTEGEKYVGEYKDRLRHGQGTYIYHNGNKYIGEWKKGESLNGTGYDKYGKILYKIVNGESIK